MISNDRAGARMGMFLGLLETQGNQSFVYATNRERAARGASELLQVSTTSWLYEILKGPGEIKPSEMILELRERWLASPANNQWRESEHFSGLTVVVATSGRAVILSDNEESLRTLISQATEKVLRDAPGLSLVGSIEAIDENEEDCFGRAQRRAAVRLGTNLATLPSVHHRMAQLPPVEVCRASGLPSEHFVRVGSDHQVASAQITAQLSWATHSKNRFSRTIGQGELADNVDEIPTSKSWRAVVHADGNGVGKVFTGLSRLLWRSGDAFSNNLSRWINGYREFSIALEDVTERALYVATKEVGARRTFPILLGGDDITVELSADVARRFTETYLTSFETFSKDAINVLKRIGVAEEDLPDRFTAAAGIAIVKSHFPFHVAYDLALELIENAKSHKATDSGDSVSTFDIHVLYDSTSSGLDEVRQRLVSSEQRQLWGGPYSVSDSPSMCATAKQLDSLCGAIKQMGRSRQINAIAQALPLGRVETERVIDNAKATGDFVPLSNVEALILDDSGSSNGRSLLIDAMNIIDVEGMSK